MGTEKHSKASKKRWVKIPKDQRKKRMAAISASGWGKLTPRQRRLRALRGVETRRLNKLNKEKLVV